MSRQLFYPRTKGLHKFYIQYEDFKNSGKVSCLSYLVKSEDNLLAALPVVCEMELHVLWKDYLVLQLKNYRCLRFRLFSWLIEMQQKIADKHLHSIRLCEHCSLMFNSSTKLESKHAKIKLKIKSFDNTLHNLEPEIRWSVRILAEMLEHLHLEAVFAWLSTLGGAHSALGDYFNKNAEVAWELSLKQLYIAIKIGNPALAAHCKLFMSISLMQRGHFRAASKIIRAVSNDIVNDKRLHERRLINCCKAARVRLKYIKQEKKEMKNGIHN